MAHSALLVQEVRLRSQWWGSSKRVARELGISPERLSQIKGGASIGKRAAATILAKVREEDLALADRIEEELTQSWREELRRLDQ